MIINWQGRPGWRNKKVEIDHAVSGDYYFSLCRREEPEYPPSIPEDPFSFRVFVYRKNYGERHLGGFDSIEDAKAFVAGWEDDVP